MLHMVSHLGIICTEALLHAHQAVLHHVLGVVFLPLTLTCYKNQLGKLETQILSVFETAD